ncbi:Galactokinase [Planctomycetes bacterium Poly30]|uniref:Galactokinase n=1 Tax=Saltatorellus ferox TaxID=2528018 RepID=A0A518EQ69_9BACT|nr:Galactokinase [Planctomycetes bacterium Poly30]
MGPLSSSPTPTLGSSADGALEGGLEASLAAHRTAFRAAFGPATRILSYFSPGRVNLFGGHLDYNGGPVVPTAIDRGTFLCLAPRKDGRVRLVSTFGDQGFDGTLGSLPDVRQGAWFDYPLGVVRELIGTIGQKERLRGGFDLLFGGNLPVGAGLSSSASICVGTAFALDNAFELGLDPVDRVSAALASEREFVGVQCGIMDPYAVGFARPRRVLWLDCKDRSFEHLPLDFDRLSIGVVDTGVQRALARGEFNRRVAECKTAFDVLQPHAPGSEVMRDVPRDVLDAHVGELDPTVAKRATHVLEEVQRTFLAREALLVNDFTKLGELMTATHRSFQTLYECSCEELDVLVDAAVACDGVFGARLTGAGFGGCIVMLVDADATEQATASVQIAFEKRYGRTPPVAFFQGDEGPRRI